MMLLVSLPETESEGEGLRRSSAGPMFRTDDSDLGVSETGVSWRMDTSKRDQLTRQHTHHFLEKAVL